jgi:hypothetical protein
VEAGTAAQIRERIMEMIGFADQDLPDRFERVAELIHGFETPFGMELLATVHWVCTREGAKSDDEAVERIYVWSERKRGFGPSQIALARNVLETQGWLT